MNPRPKGPPAVKSGEIFHFDSDPTIEYTATEDAYHEGAYWYVQANISTGGSSKVKFTKAEITVH